MAKFMHSNGNHAKPILLRPTAELRKKLEEEAKDQCRSLHNIVLIILLKHFNITNAR